MYPFFESGTIISSDLNRGLIVSRNDVRPADFNADGYLDCTDINQLIAAIATGSGQTWFDLTDDGALDLADRDAWLAAAGNENGLAGPYLLGDLNLDGFVDGQDFIEWNQHKFTTNADWCSGDINADGVIDGQDFIQWNANKFQSSDGSAQTVPEPAAVCLLLVALLMPPRRLPTRYCQ